MGLERSGRTPEAIAAYETALGLGYQPALLHRHLVELFKTIDAQKADEHKRAFIRIIRQPLYRADFKSNLAEGEPPPGS